MVTELFTVDGEVWCRYADGEIRKRRKLYCKSTDTKPTQGMRNIDSLSEFDTGKYFLFDEDTQAWVEQ